MRGGGFGARGVRVPGSRPQVLSMGERMETSLSVGARLKQVCPHGPGRWYGVALGRGKYGGAGCLRVRVCACMRLCVGQEEGGRRGTAVRQDFAADAIAALHRKAAEVSHHSAVRVGWDGVGWGGMGWDRERLWCMCVSYLGLGLNGMD